METKEAPYSSESAERRPEDAGDAAAGSVDLPLHLTEKILCCINPLKSVRLATVCKSWAATVSDRLAWPLAPHLFVCRSPEEKPGRRGVIVSVPLDGARLPSAAVISSRVRWADTTGLSCIGATPGGRLAFACSWSTSVFLVNPVTGASECVNLHGLRPETTPKLVTSGGSDSLLFISIDVDRLLLWRRDAERTYCWSPLATDHTRGIYKILSVTECNGCFYLLCDLGHVYMIDPTMPQPLRMVMLPVVRPTANFREGYLLQSDGEILLVLRLRDYEQVECLSCGHSTFHSVIVGFEVYVLDAKDKRWTKVEKLAGDGALFVGQESSFALRAPETLGCITNCVYFTGRKRYYSCCRNVSDNTWGVYSLEDEKILFEHAFMITAETAKWATEFWFLPSVVYAM